MVWATEHSKNYLYGAEFEEQFEDHRALLSALNGNQSNKTMNSRLSRWVNSRRLLPFVFRVKHILGKEIGFINLLSRLPSKKALQTSHYDKKFVVSTINEILAKIVLNSHCKKKKCINNDLLIDNQVNVNIQRSFFASILNYVTDTLLFYNSNHSRSESCTSSCIPLNPSRFKFNQTFLSDKSYFFVLTPSILSIFRI